MSAPRDQYQMSTGEIVEIVTTRCYVTPQGDTLQHQVRVVQRHSFRSSREVNGALLPCIAVLERGSSYHLTPAELARNGERLQ